MHCCGKCSACRKLKEGGFALCRRKGSGKCYYEMETETTVGISPMNAQLGSCDGSTRAEVASKITLSFEVLHARLVRGEVRGDTGKSVHGLPRDHFERAPRASPSFCAFLKKKACMTSSVHFGRILVACIVHDCGEQLQSRSILPSIVHARTAE